MLHHAVRAEESGATWLSVSLHISFGSIQRYATLLHRPLCCEQSVGTQHNASDRHSCKPILIGDEYGGNADMLHQTQRVVSNPAR